MRALLPAGKLLWKCDCEHGPRPAHRATLEFGGGGHSPVWPAEHLTLRESSQTMFVRTASGEAAFCSCNVSARIAAIGVAMLSVLRRK